jgi:DNA replication protein DnaC
MIAMAESEELEDLMASLATRVDDEKSKQWEKEQRAVFIRSLATEADIPDQVRHTIRTTKPGSDDKRIAERLERFRMLVLHGPPGTGKSTAAIRWLFRHADIPKAYFIDAYNYSKVKPHEDAYRRAHSSKVLVLDDVGREKWMPKPIQWLLRDRYNKRYTTTLITTNYDPQRFIRVYGQHIWSRLMEEGDTLEMKKVRRRR